MQKDGKIGIDTTSPGARLEIAGDVIAQGALRNGPIQTVGGPYENMAKYSEDFSVATWDRNGGTCTVSANAAAAPDGNQTADQITASTATPVLQQQIAGLTAGGTYTFYVWARVASGTRKVSIAIAQCKGAGREASRFNNGSSHRRSAAALY